MIEPPIYWECHSIDDLVESRLDARLLNDGAHIDFDVADPIDGRLSAASTEPKRS